MAVAGQMAYPWACDFNPPVQMESPIKGRVLSIIVAGAMIASTSTVLAATPKPKPTAKSIAKSRPMPLVRKPSQKWPPLGFINPSHGEIYYRLPMGPELLGELSAAAALSQQLKACAKLACGVVKIASTNGCTWWQIDSTVSGPLSATDLTKVPYGALKTTAKGTDKKQITTVILISTEPLKANIGVGGINISCYHTPATTSLQKIPSNVYTVNTPTPSPSELATTNTN